MVSLSKFIKKEIELRENLVGTGFLDPPTIKNDPIVKQAWDSQKREIVSILDQTNESADYRVTVIGEIVSASGFQAERLYIFYDTFLTEGWTFEDSNSYEMSDTVRDERDEVNRR